jgi:hypothetical protein
MSVFKILANNLKKINTDILVKQVVEQIDEEIILLNAENQLDERGVDNEGSSLGQYSESYKKIKRKKGQRTDHVTLRDTGKFKNLFKVKAKKEEAEIYSTDKKTLWLMKRYGRDIFGLTDDNLQMLIDLRFKPFIINNLKKLITNGL